MERGNALLSFLVCCLLLLERSLLHASATNELAKAGNLSNDRIGTALYDHGDDAKEMPQHMVARTPSSAESNDPYLKTFFKIEDLKVGKVIPLYFPSKNPSTTPNILPREEADSVPFSSSHLHFLLDLFGFPPNSEQAQAIESTLKHCEFPPLEGETKFCATSLESMLDNLRANFGKEVDFKVLTTTTTDADNPSTSQNYTILSHKQVHVPRMIGCHPMPYPYAVFYCHGQAGDTQLYLIRLRDGPRRRRNRGIIKAVGVCHMDTSHWDPNHIAFKVVGAKPGSAPICHFFLPDNMVWIPTSSTSTMI